MRFVVLMAAREMRASWKRLLFFFICIAVGVGAIVALRSVIQSVRHVFAGEARTLIAADAVISSNRAITPELQEKIDQRLAEAGATAIRSVELATMVRAEGREDVATRKAMDLLAERAKPVAPGDRPARSAARPARRAPRADRRPAPRADRRAAPRARARAARRPPARRA